MNRLEFKTIMKVMEIDALDSIVIGRNGTKEIVYSLNDVSMNYSGNDYSVVRGKIPLEVAMTIYEKYPDNRYGIRVYGGNDDFSSLMNVKEDKETNDRKCQYIGFYHVDTKEGLIILLTELMDYYNRCNGLKETEVQRIDEIISKVDEEVLKVINPSISTNAWMKNKVSNNGSYFETLKRIQETDDGVELRSLLEEFDGVVNPYMNNNVELDKIEIYNQKVLIQGGNSDSSSSMNLHIKDINSKNQVSIYRDQYGFSYQLFCSLGNQQYLSVLHYYTQVNPDSKENGEIIAVEYFGDSFKQNMGIRYNLTNGLAGRNSGEKSPINSLEKSFIYNELKKAIEYAKGITIKNMVLMSKSKIK